MDNISIALDGPAGAGKSTIAKIIAKRKNLTYIDTGAMYRAIALKILREGIDIDKEESIQKVLSASSIDLEGNDIFLDGQLVTEEIRTPKVNNFVSHVARIPLVRMKMVELQRSIAANKNVIMDGRDIGTYVIPNATYKFYLTASIEERAKRRFIELRDKGFDTTIEIVKEEIKNRDKIDIEREFAPLRKAEDAIEIDTTGKSIEDVVEEILNYMK
ncbi:(d)CMP kinase [Crassaminicella indica]|uniref:Cytidylate kinase n=1 Tax=Crassaminicella indica TaxID=2855394 RepID=A0ABX8RAF5_9CLOT|nr:(d)CMP kinase [Crassaminicella indica]QXM06049.1 (d)CMP kinase [Crassaminicella indica]